ncbi:MAG: hypothetical protein A2887_04680 [Alphaproteobacteria bacterium RIFCSPLOWO2_01_FULL_40_26]|nr:MAG: hypothetical protein A3D15_04485 [Alphaproteobacteria bacterium RIFCSPHIGHO2_02_FULL_40_34]OFW87532.1 MAG: hypothetical protein A2794_03905 [Alphaproteobacteria bacterium RIFCSPHIGHO2_01_FULL_40_8]OFW94358.1 MAG: hypothetical protein A2887_04680 [Alphaproteobacteria bacterium RIFCSPLOWO2_01_FULL_40_26]OFX09494.1 MAG: hypothetical protein A3H30_02275 [Alphaproteobacteria bacterium RIFCSPLOWO2_02_FULL_40_19]OFX11125.1 MAG: hypothetical protein A3G22_02835 [Alphaproteobacteria bacterium RI
MFEEYRIKDCRVLDGYKVRLSFLDGASGIADLSHLVGKGVFALWNDYEKFKKVSINPETRTICWENGVIDLDPITLRNNLKS